jgi:hypothetical protein
MRGRLNMEWRNNVMLESLSAVHLLRDEQPYLYIKERKSKRWWSTIPPISTKRAIASHIRSLNMKKVTTYSVLTSSVVDCGFESRAGQTNDYEIDMCCLSPWYTDGVGVNQQSLTHWLMRGRLWVPLTSYLPPHARGNTCQFNSRWFDPLGIRTHNLPRLRWAR